MYNIDSGFIVFLIIVLIRLYHESDILKLFVHTVCVTPYGDNVLHTKPFSRVGDRLTCLISSKLYTSWDTVKALLNRK